MELRKTYSTDAELERHGVDVHLGENAYITIARAGGANVRHEATMRRLLQPHKRALAAGTLDEATATSVMQAAFAESVVIGWRGIEVDGVEFPYSRENALTLFADFPEVWRIVQEEAARFTNFRREEHRDEGKA